MTEEKLMTERESLDLIASMINKAKNNFSERGLLYLIWGWVILFCCITSFIGTYFFHNDKIYFVWLTIYLVIIFQIFYIRRARKSQKSKTYTGEINAFVWLVFTICLILVIYICNVLHRYEIINPLLLVLYGMPTFLSGIILKFKPLVVGALFCWALAVVSPFIDMDFQVLLIAMAVVVAWILPGFLLKKRFKTNG